MGNTYKDRKGYPRWNDSNRLVHRDVARNIYGSIGEGRVVHHRDGDKSNCRRANSIAHRPFVHAPSSA